MSRHYSTLILVFITCLLSSLPAYADTKVLVLHGNESRITLQPYLFFAPAERGSDLDTPKIWSAASNRSDMNFGYTRKGVWLRLTVASNAPARTTWKLHFPYSSLDYVALYETDQPPQFSGDTIPLSQRAIAHRDPVFTLQLEPGEQRTLYLQSQSEGSLTLDSQLWSVPAFQNFSERTLVLIALYLGMLLALASYNLLLFCALRERAYLMYVGFVLSFGLGAVAFTGIGARYFWPEATEWSNRMLPFSLCLSATVGIFFARHFLDTAHNLPRWHQALTIVARGILLLTFASLIIPIPLALRGTSFAAAIGTVVLFSCIILSVRKQVPGARIFLLAWSILVVGVLLLALRNFSLIPSNPLTTYAMHVGSALEMLLLSFALANRVNILKQQKEEAQTSLLLTLREHEQELEQRVQERTQELAEANARLESLAMQDSLTGLANRAALERYIEHALRRSQRRQEYLAVMLVDLDDFKQINDQLGHETGDIVLRCIAERMNDMARDSDFIARLGGDEFVLVAEGIKDRSQAHCLAERFLDALSLPIELSDKSISVGASIGITLTQAAQPDMALLLRESDTAMYIRKRSGRHGVSFFSRQNDNGLLV